MRAPASRGDVLTVTLPRPELEYKKCELPSHIEGLDDEEKLGLQSALEAIASEDHILVLTWVPDVITARATAGHTPSRLLMPSAQMVHLMPGVLPM
jgi:hypothetical protein